MMKAMLNTFANFMKQFLMYKNSMPFFLARRLKYEKRFIHNMFRDLLHNINY